MMESAGLLPYRPYSRVERDDIARGLPSKPSVLPNRILKRARHIRCCQASTMRKVRPSPKSHTDVPAYHDSVCSWLPASAIPTNILSVLSCNKFPDRPTMTSTWPRQQLPEVLQQ